ncbi:MAG: hypothetical protein PHX21_14005 [bacterium]|nr:hypothetical protein [bacterium]
MQKLSEKKDKTLFYIVIIILITGFSYFIIPILNLNKNLNNEIKLNREKLNKYSRLIKQKNYIKDEYSKYPSIFKITNEQPDVPVNTLAILEYLAKDANIKIIDMRVKNISGKSTGLGYEGVIIDLRSEGVMEGYFSFIYNLENSPSLLKIQRFQLNAKPNSRTLEGDFSIAQLR